MAQILKLRRSSIAGSKPLNSNIELGELAINTTDGALYFAKSSSLGVASVEQIVTTNSTATGSVNISGSSTFIGPVTITGSLTSTENITLPGYIEFNDITTLPTGNTNSYFYLTSSFPGTTDFHFTNYSGSNESTVRLGWLEQNLYTGLLYGGRITAVSGSTTFNITNGHGIIVELNAAVDKEPFPVVKRITWPDYTGVTLTHLTSSIQTFLGIDNNGAIIQQTQPWNDGQYNTSISLGTVLHQNQTFINSSINYPNVAYGYKQRTYDFIKAFGSLKLSGFDIQPSGSLGLTVASGTAFSEGRNYTIDPNNPSYIVDTGTTVSKIFRYRQVSGTTYIQDTNGGVGYNVIDPANYNNNGVLTSISPSTPFSIQRVFWYPNSATKGIVVYYGNTQYNSKTEAIANVTFEKFNEVENTKQNAIYLGAIVIKYNGVFTNPDDYAILPGGIFRNVGGGGGSAGIGGGSLATLSDTNIALSSYGDLLVYNGATTLWSNTKNLTGSYVITGSIYVSDNISGSFVGNGSGLTNIPVSGITNLQLDKIVSGSVSASISPTNGFRVNTDTYIDGTLTAKELHIAYVTSSVLYESGSTKFGDTIDDTHQVTGSLLISGSVNVNGVLSGTTATFSNTVTAGTSIYTYGGTGNYLTLTSNQLYSTGGLLYLNYANIQGVNILTNGATGLLTVGTASTFLSGITATGIIQSDDQNGFRLYQSGNATDTKYWSIQNLTSSGQFRIRALNDTLTNGINAVTLSRTGISDVSIELGGNVGIGVTPSAWVGATGLQIQYAIMEGRSSLPSFAEYGANTYSVSGTRYYIASDYATRYTQYLGEHRFFTAPSGTTGAAITFTQAMTLDASGNLGVGTTTPAGYQLGGKFVVAGSTSGFYFNDTSNRLVLDGAGTNRDLSFYFRYSNSASIISDSYLIFSTNNSERGRITASGNWLIGTTTDAGYKLHVNGTLNSNGDISLAAWKILSNTAGSILGFGGINSAEWTQINLYTGGSSRMSINNSLISLNVPLYVTGKGEFNDDSNTLFAGLDVRNINDGSSAITRFRVGNNTSANAFTITTYSSAHLSLGNITQVVNQNNANLELGGWGDIALKLMTGNNAMFTSKLGIGVTPTYTLDLYNAGSSLYQRMTSGGGSLLMGVDSIGFAFVGTTALPMYFNIDSAERMRLTSNGNLLIGTTTDAGQNLQINGTFKSNHFWTDNGGLSYWGNYPSAYGGFTWDTGYATVWATAGNELRFGADGASAKVTLKTSGNLLINTTSSNNYKLQVKQSGATDGIVLYSQNATTQNALLVYHNDSVAVIETTYFGSGAFKPLALNTQGGNVLIGTTTDAGYKLDVNGTGRFSGIVTFNSSITSTFVTIAGPTGLAGGYGLALIENGNNRWFIGQNWSGGYATNDLEIYSNTFGTILALKYTTGAAIFNNTVTATQYNLSALNTTPSSASDTGTLGEVRIDASYIYVCIATNTWKRTALSTW